MQPNDELMIITHKGVIIRQRIDAIRETGRVAQGVKLINLDEGDSVAAIAKILQEADTGSGQDGDAAIDGAASE